MPKIFLTGVCILRKVNDDGDYCPFPGITVISKVNDKTMSSLLYQGLMNCPVARKYYAILPARSYHMTTYYLSNQAEFSDSVEDDALWRAYVNRELPCLQAVSQAMLELPTSIDVSIHEILVTPRVIQLAVNLPADILQQIKALSNHPNRFNRPLYCPDRFHITLAYLYKALPKNEYHPIIKEIHQELKSLQVLRLNSIITLAAPALCYFNDMTDFYSWQGDSYPFDKSERNSVGLFKKKAETTVNNTAKIYRTENTSLR